MNADLVPYHLCPHCFRAVPEVTGEVYCPNDGTLLLTACLHCDAAITSPYSRFCVRCGLDLAMKRGGVMKKRK